MAPKTLSASVKSESKIYGIIDIEISNSENSDFGSIIKIGEETEVKLINESTPEEEEAPAP